MYKCPDTFGAGNGLSRVKRTPIEFTNTFLALPTIEKAVPVKYAEGLEPCIVSLARYLAKLNLLTPEDRRQSDDLPRVVQSVLKREIDRQTGEMKQFQLAYRFASPRSAYVDIGCHDSDEAIIFAIENNASSIPFLKIVPALNQLNAVHPELGQTIYAVLEKASVRSMCVLTFANCLERFEYELRVETTKEDDEPESEEDSYLTLEDIHGMAEKFPVPWVYSPDTVLTPYEVWNLSKKRRTPKLVKDCILAALDVAKAYEEDAGTSYLGTAIETETIFSLGLVEFFEQDPTQQLYDDVCQEANYCGDSYSYNLHEEIISLKNETEFMNRWNQIRLGLNLLGKLDKLFHALAQFNRKENE